MLFLLLWDTFTNTYIFMHPFDMFCSSSKSGHLGQILTSGLLGDVVVNQLTPPDPVVVQQWGSMIIQFLVAGVTIWATIRKALQKPEAVLKVPVTPPATLIVTPGPASDVTLP